MYIQSMEAVVRVESLFEVRSMTSRRNSIRPLGASAWVGGLGRPLAGRPCL